MKVKVTNTEPRLIVGAYNATDALPNGGSHAFAPGDTEVELEVIQAIAQCNKAGAALFAENGGPLMVHKPSDGQSPEEAAAGMEKARARVAEQAAEKKAADARRKAGKTADEKTAPKGKDKASGAASSS